MSGSGASAGVAGPALGTCVTPSPLGYQPTWTPPSAPAVGACTEQQVSQEYALCQFGTSTYDAVACRAFDVAPANSMCMSCMFGALGATAVGAILVMPGGQWLANRSGCIALIDGDSSATGCGAKTQAADVCKYGACLAACTLPVSDADFRACQQATENGACSAYYSQAACAELPRYASCEYPDFATFYSAMADLFCVSGLPAAGGEAGAGP